MDDKPTSREKRDRTWKQTETVIPSSIPSFFLRTHAPLLLTLLAERHPPLSPRLARRALPCPPSAALSPRPPSATSPAERRLASRPREPRPPPPRDRPPSDVRREARAPSAARPAASRRSSSATSPERSRSTPRRERRPPRDCPRERRPRSPTATAPSLSALRGRVVLVRYRPREPRPRAPPVTALFLAATSTVAPVTTTWNLNIKAKELPNDLSKLPKAEKIRPPFWPTRSWYRLLKPSHLEPSMSHGLEADEIQVVDVHGELEGAGRVVEDDVEPQPRDGLIMFCRTTQMKSP
ncbi:hypothetical protein SORBI_3006G248350 [Sorghum bicolor]|uniref:Uncharacterized protein n=1 Tax=Sorghum bicolor TaxID=4558 RepID=A0A1Z5RGJ3_SORBI|nr:hypothetical protein SORBI_3006G248350 [Sorghum bicolor]